MSNSTYPTLPVLLVDDEQAALMTNEIALSSDGVNNIEQCQDSRKVMNLLQNREFSVIVLDLTMPHITGEELLPQIAEAHPEIPVIILTASNTVETAVGCMKAGAFDYIVKPVSDNRLINTVRRALELREIRDISSSFNQKVFSGELSHPEAFSEIITHSARMFTIFQYIESVALSSQPILITGETGVGKELLARAIHRLSGRKGDFLAENLAGLDDTMFSDTLFGHVKGAFTGAEKPRQGLLEKTFGGTLLLDEIGDISVPSQIKLLRLLQEREYYPLGSDTARPADVRIVAATNKTIHELKKDPNFRNDLYFRLKTHHVHIPPLRERKEDIELLLDHFLAEAAADMGKSKPTPPRELSTLLATYQFPGNIRELRAMVYDAVGKHSSRMLSMESFKESIRASGDDFMDEPEIADSDTLFNSLDELPTIRDVTSGLIQEALRRSEGNQSIAASMLGITPSSLSKRLKRSKDD